MNMTRQNEIIKTDYLVIGGGMAGLQSAIAAASKGRYPPFRLRG